MRRRSWPGTASTATTCSTGRWAGRAVNVGSRRRHGRTGYRLLETIRVYARQRLSELDDPPGCVIAIWSSTSGWPGGLTPVSRVDSPSPGWRGLWPIWMICAPRWTGRRSRPMEARGPTRDEVVRLAELRSLGLLDDESEERFDRVTRLAQRLFDVPIALVSLIDEDRQWFGSVQGLDVRETPREVSFWAHAIHGDDVFHVPDATADARFADNPLVLGDPQIRFYAGAPISGPRRLQAGNAVHHRPQPASPSPGGQSGLAGPRRHGGTGDRRPAAGLHKFSIPSGVSVEQQKGHGQVLSRGDVAR
jgi:hypothetical protein